MSLTLDGLHWIPQKKQWEYTPSILWTRLTLHYRQSQRDFLRSQMVKNLKKCSKILLNDWKCRGKKCETKTGEWVQKGDGERGGEVVSGRGKRLEEVGGREWWGGINKSSVQGVFFINLRRFEWAYFSTKKFIAIATYTYLKPTIIFQRLSHDKILTSTRKY